jgi:hypothetical protein
VVKSEKINENNRKIPGLFPAQEKLKEVCEGWNGMLGLLAIVGTVQPIHLVNKISVFPEPPMKCENQ